MADLEEFEKACQFFDGCHRSGAGNQDMLYYAGVLLCKIATGLEINVDNLEITALTDAELRATPVPVSLPAAVVRTPSITYDDIVGTASVAAGARRIEFLLDSDFEGTIDGVAFSGADDYSVGPFVADGGNTLDAIDYEITAGGLRILKVV